MNVRQLAYETFAPDDVGDCLTVKQLLENYRRGHRNFQRVSLPVSELSDLPLRGLSLSRVDFFQARLIWTDWRYSTLTEMKLDRALLWRSNFANTMLIGSSFAKANALGSNFTNADLHTACFSCADLRLANFQDADLTNVNFVGTDLRYANLSGANLAGANLSQARLDGANLCGADLYRTKMQHTIFDRTRLENVNLGETAFVAFDLDTAKLLRTPNFAMSK